MSLKSGIKKLFRPKRKRGPAAIRRARQELVQRKSRRSADKVTKVMNEAMKAAGRSLVKMGQKIPDDRAATSIIFGGPSTPRKRRATETDRDMRQIGTSMRRL